MLVDCPREFIIELSRDKRHGYRSGRDDTWDCDQEWLHTRPNRRIDKRPIWGTLQCLHRLIDLCQLYSGIDE